MIVLARGDNLFWARLADGIDFLSTRAALFLSLQDIAIAISAAAVIKYAYALMRAAFTCSLALVLAAAESLLLEGYWHKGARGNNNASYRLLLLKQSRTSSERLAKKRKLSASERRK